MPLEGHCSSFLRFHWSYSFCDKRWSKDPLLGRLMVGDQPLYSQFRNLFRVVMIRNSSISYVLATSHPLFFLESYLSF